MPNLNQSWRRPCASGFDMLASAHLLEILKGRLSASTTDTKKPISHQGKAYAKRYLAHLDPKQRTWQKSWCVSWNEDGVMGKLCVFPGFSWFCLAYRGCWIGPGEGCTKSALTHINLDFFFSSSRKVWSIGPWLLFFVFSTMFLLGAACWTTLPKL